MSKVAVGVEVGIACASAKTFAEFSRTHRHEVKALEVQLIVPRRLMICVEGTQYARIKLGEERGIVPVVPHALILHHHKLFTSNVGNVIQQPG